MQQCFWLSIHYNFSATTRKFLLHRSSFSPCYFSVTYTHVRTHTDQKIKKRFVFYRKLEQISPDIAACFLLTTTVFFGKNDSVAARCYLDRTGRGARQFRYSTRGSFAQMRLHPMAVRGHQHRGALEFSRRGHPLLAVAG